MAEPTDCKQLNIPLAGVTPGKAVFECVPPPNYNDINDTRTRAFAKVTFVNIMSTFMAIVIVMIAFYLLYITRVEPMDAIARYDDGAQIGLGPYDDIVLQG